jgi:hypothetical protein
MTLTPLSTMLKIHTLERKYKAVAGLLDFEIEQIKRKDREKQEKLWKVLNK